MQLPSWLTAAASPTSAAKVSLQLSLLLAEASPTTRPPPGKLRAVHIYLLHRSDCCAPGALYVNKPRCCRYRHMCSVCFAQCTIWRRPPGVQPRPGRHRRQHLLGTPGRPLHQPGWHGFLLDTHTTPLCTAHPNIHLCLFAIRRLSSMTYGVSMLSVWAGCRMCPPTTGRRGCTTCPACLRASLARPHGALRHSSACPATLLPASSHCTA